MVGEERRRNILSYLERNGTAKATDLAFRFNVSLMTIHRDLTLLAEQELITKVHGGAIAKHVTEVPYYERIVHHQQNKIEIAARAAQILADGMTIYLGPGTTVTELARALPDEGLRILTNSMPIAHELSVASTHEILLTGGRIRRFAEALVGPTAEAAFEGQFLHFAFIAVTGIDIDVGLTVYSESEARVLKAAMRAAKTTVLLTDSSKFGRVMGPVVAPLFAVHKVISDAEMPERYREFFDRQNVDCEFVNLKHESGTGAR